MTLKLRIKGIDIASQAVKDEKSIQRRVSSLFKKQKEASRVRLRPVRIRFRYNKAGANGRGQSM